jgi:transposase
MANTPISMSKLRQVLKLHLHGRSKLQISQMTGVSRNTVAKYVAHLQRLGFTADQLAQHSNQQLENLFCLEPPQETDARIPVLHDFIERNDKRMRRRGMTHSRLYEDYHQQHPEGFGKTAFYRHYGLWKRRTKPSMHLEHKAGDKMFVDFTGEKLPMVDPHTGEIVAAECFVAILPASQMTYVQAVVSQRVEDFIRCCENALYYFGGAPAAMVPDNLKSAVIKTHKYEPTLNDNYEAFADHFSMAVVPARARRPKDKAHVENAVKITYRKIFVELPARPPVGLAALNALIAPLLEAYNDRLLTGRTYSRRSYFEEVEKPTLQPLPQHRYQLRHARPVTVQKNGHVYLSVDRHFYSVPHAFISKKARVLFDDERVDVYHRHECIASHPRVRTPHAYTSDTSHLASHHQIIAAWSPEYFLEQARSIDPTVEGFIDKVLNRKQHPEQAYRTCNGILSFARRVGVQRLINACQRADSFGLYTYKSIADILTRGLDAQREEEHDKPSMPTHANIRGPEYFSRTTSPTPSSEDHDWKRRTKVPPSIGRN